VPVDWESREALEEVLGESAGGAVQILDPQRGKKREMIDLSRKTPSSASTSASA